MFRDAAIGKQSKFGCRFKVLQEAIAVQFLRPISQQFSFLLRGIAAVTKGAYKS